METTPSRTERRHRPARSASEWKGEVESWKDGGLTAEAYALKHDLNPGTLKWWASAVNKGRVSGLARRPAGSTPKAKASVSFLPLRVASPAGQAPETATVEAEIVLNGGRRVRVTSAMSLDQLARLLDAVERAV